MCLLLAHWRTVHYPGQKGLHLHGEKQKLIEKMKITEHKIDIKRKQLQLNF